MKTNAAVERRLGSTTLVLGSTGKTGRRVAERLRALKIETRLGSRSANPAFEWNDPGTWEANLEDVSAVYITFAPDLAVPGAADSIGAFTRMAVAMGVERLVLLSGRGEEEAQRCERIVAEAGVEWTVVRASWFMQNFSEGEFVDMVLDGTIALPAGGTPEPFVDINDIADVVVAALTETGHSGQIYEVTGPRLMTLEEATQEIAKAAGRQIQYVQLSTDVFARALSESGMPEDMVWLLSYLFETVLDGRNAYVCDGVQRALGREPADFSDYARRIAAGGVWDVRIAMPA